MLVSDTIVRTVIVPTSGGRADSLHSEKSTIAAATQARRDTATYQIPSRDAAATLLYANDTTATPDTSASFENNLLGNDSVYSTEIIGKQHGETGVPLPYNVAGDNVITALLIATILLTLISLSRSRQFMARQTKDFFRIQHGDVITVSETSNEIAAQLFLSLQTCLMLSVLSFLYIRQFIADVFTFDSPYALLWILIGCFVAFYVVKAILYIVANLTFFDTRSNERWLSIYLYILAAQGLLMLPAVLLQVYFDIAIETVLIYTLSVVVLAKILSFYKCYTIFLRRRGGILQLILYFCALEMTPPLLLWGIMVMIIDCFKVNI